jgi:hypothetical protein
LQHQQLRELHAENATLQRSSAEAGRLKADLDRSTGDESQDEAEIARLRDENHDLLKLRNEVNQLRDMRVQFEKAKADNLRLQSNVVHRLDQIVKETAIQRVKMEDLANQGWGTPEATMQTFFWALRNRNFDILMRCFSAPRQAEVRRGFESAGEEQQKFWGNLAAIEIMTRVEVSPTAVQLSLNLIYPDGSTAKMRILLNLHGQNWELDNF